MPMVRRRWRRAMALRASAAEDPPQGAQRMAGADANAHEGYVSWGEVRGDPDDGQQQRPHQPRYHGAPKHGDALLAGLIRCRRCRRKLTLRYSGYGHSIPRYSCGRGWMDGQRAVASPLVACASTMPSSMRFSVLSVPVPSQPPWPPSRKETAAGPGAGEQLRDLEAARYTADRAFRQYDASDRRTASWPASSKRAGTRRLPVSRRSRARSPRSTQRDQYLLAIRRRNGAATDLETIWAAPTTDRD